MIQFPECLRDFLMTSLPVSKGFYNWRNTTKENVEYIKKIIKQPMEDIEEMAEKIYWYDDWGDEPENTIDTTKAVKERLQKAPKLIPIYSHRYIPMLIDTTNIPIISIHGIDVIYYGENLEDYFNVEFGSKRQDEIAFENISPIPFWSEIM